RPAPATRDTAANPPASPARGTPADGIPARGTPADGIPARGTPADGIPDGTPADGVPARGTPARGTSSSATPGRPGRTTGGAVSRPALAVALLPPSRRPRRSRVYSRVSEGTSTTAPAVTPMIVAISVDRPAAAWLTVRPGSSRGSWAAAQP